MSHRPCVTETVVYPPTDSTAYGREMCSLQCLCSFGDVAFVPYRFTGRCRTEYKEFTQHRTYVMLIAVSMWEELAGKVGHRDLLTTPI